MTSNIIDRVGSDGLHTEVLVCDNAPLYPIEAQFPTAVYSGLNYIEVTQIVNPHEIHCITPETIGEIYEYLKGKGKL